MIFLNAVILTCLSLKPLAASPPQPAPFKLARTLAVAAAAFLLTTLGSWGTVRAIYGDTFAGHARKQTRFGPNGPAAGPKPGQAHP